MTSSYNKCTDQYCNQVDPEEALEVEDLPDSDDEETKTAFRERVKNAFRLTEDEERAAAFARALICRALDQAPCSTGQPSDRGQPTVIIPEGVTVGPDTPVYELDLGKLLRDLVQEEEGDSSPGDSAESVVHGVVVGRAAGGQ